MLTTKTATLKQGYVFRPGTMDDASGVLAIIRACDMAVTGESDETLDNVLTEWRTPGLNLETDVRVIGAPDGGLVGYAIVLDAIRPMTPIIDVFIHPDYWDNTLDSVLMAWAEERSRAAFAKVPPDARVAMQSYTFSKDKYYKSVLERAGMQPIRHAFRMVIDLDQPLAQPQWPDGISLRVFQAGDDKCPVLVARRDSFKDHWGYVDSPFEEHYERWTHHWGEDFDPSLWFLAMDGDQVAGICLCRSQRGDDESLGWVSTLGVTRPYRRQGVGRALLLYAFQELRARGKARAGLGVVSPGWSNRRYRWREIHRPLGDGLLQRHQQRL